MRTFLVFLVLLVVSLMLGLQVRHQYMSGELTSGLRDTPNVANDLRGKTVTLPDDTKPGHTLGWYFSPRDELTVDVVDRKLTERGPVYYCLVTSETADGKQKLSGVMQVGYTKVANKTFLTMTNNVALHISKSEQAKAKCGPVELLPKAKK